MNEEQVNSPLPGPVEPFAQGTPIPAESQPNMPMPAPPQAQMQAQPIQPNTGQPINQQVVPGQQPIQQVVVNNNSGSNIVGFKGPNHVLHLILTIVTVGVWLPVWIVIALRNKQKPQYG